MNKCEACGESFEWDDKAVIVDGDIYHKNCLTLYPNGYVAFVGDEFLGETENEDGQMACEIIEGLLDD